MLVILPSVTVMSHPHCVLTLSTFDKSESSNGSFNRTPLNSNGGLIFGLADCGNAADKSKQITPRRFMLSFLRPVPSPPMRFPRRCPCDYNQYNRSTLWATNSKWYGATFGRSLGIGGS